MTTALVLVDLQNDYFPGGTMELVGADAAAGRAAELRRRSAGARFPSSTCSTSRPGSARRSISRG